MAAGGKGHWVSSHHKEIDAKVIKPLDAALEAYHAKDYAKAEKALRRAKGVAKKVGGDDMTETLDRIDGLVEQLQDSVKRMLKRY